MTYIVKTPDTCGGKARIDGTRITTGLIVRNMEAGWSVDEILYDYPSLTREAIEAAVRYENRFWRRIRRHWWPQFDLEGTITWRGREWEVG